MESCSFSAILEGQRSCCLQYVWFLTTLESDFTASIIVSSFTKLCTMYISNALSEEAGIQVGF